MNTWVSFQSAEQPLLGQFSVRGNSQVSALRVFAEMSAQIVTCMTDAMVFSIKAVSCSFNKFAGDFSRNDGVFFGGNNEKFAFEILNNGKACTVFPASVAANTRRKGWAEFYFLGLF